MIRTAAYRAATALPVGAFAGATTPTPDPLASPALDWRMPASVTVSSGISGSASALNTAQAAASSKSRPSVAIGASAEEWIEYEVQAAGTALLSFAWSGGESAVVSVNGVLSEWEPYAPTTFPPATSRFLFATEVEVGDTLRLTVTASASGNSIYPLLHLKPESGAWDAHVLFGASRENPQLSRTFENAVIATWPDRDPIILNYALSGTHVADLEDTQVPAFAARHAGHCCFAMIGSILGNDVTDGRPYDSGEAAALSADYASVIGQLKALGLIVVANSTSYRAYTSPATLPATQLNGSREYNDAVLFPLIAAELPHCWDPALERPYVDEYLRTLLHRDLLADQVHGSTAQYTEVRAMWIEQWFARLYDGAWGDSEAERIVSALETAASGPDDEFVAAYKEAVYAMVPLADTTAKTALAGRIAALASDAANAAYAVADALVAAAELSGDPGDITDATASVDDLEAIEGATGRVTDLRDRLAALAEPPTTRTALINHGDTPEISGWNLPSSEKVAGTCIADILDTEGNATGWSYVVDTAFTDWPSSTTRSSAIPWMHGNAFLRSSARNGGSPAWRFTGLDDGKLYDIDILAFRSGSGDRNVVFTIAGEAQAQVNASENTDTLVTKTGISPVDGEIAISAALGSPNNGFTYLTATRIVEHS